MARSTTALALLAALALWPAGCGARRNAAEVTRDLAGTAEEIALILASARTREDLESSETRLRELVAKTSRLDAESRKARPLASGVPSEPQQRLDAALTSIVQTRTAWIQSGRTDMLEFADALRAR